ncbi:MAG: multidrug effflux MFS transporter [Yoonia sp.]|nr:multidrug effflux MFS transporter [Yoonia sp.]
MLTPTKKLHEREFIALVAMLFASVAFSIDAMLPALSTIGAELSPADPSRAALVIGVFVLGMGIGTLFAGPLSDAYGRKALVIWPFAVFIIGSLICAVAPSLEVLLAGRFVQGLAVAGPRIAGMAMVRDLYSGTKMASIMSLAMIVFGLIPAVAPLIGQGIKNLFGWHSIFVSMALLGVINSIWLGLRQPESHPVEARRPMRIASLWEATKMAFSNRVFRYSVAVLTCLYGALFTQISLIQPIFEIYYDKADSFPLWFGAIALLTMTSSFINAKLVGRFGMRKIVQTVLIAQIFLASGVIVYQMTAESLPFWIYFIWATSVMFVVGFTFGNLNALSMEPMGKIAGLAASISGSICTVLAAFISIGVSLAFDGTPFALSVGVLACVAVGFVLMRILGPRRATDES